MPRLRRLAAVGLLAAGWLGCGPVEYANQVRGRAASALLEARRAGAEVLAPYEYTAAQAFLDKAREEGARSSYQTAIEYGRSSEELAIRARGIARQRADRSVKDAATAP